jgi:hypothetical protein
MHSGALHNVALVTTDVSAFFCIGREAYPRYELWKCNSLATLKMESISSSETSVLTRAIRYKVPEDIFHWCRGENFSEDRGLRTYTSCLKFHITSRGTNKHVLNTLRFSLPKQLPVLWHGGDWRGRNKISVVRFEIFTAATMKNAVFWDKEPQFVPRRRHITSPLQSPAG